MIFSHLVFVGIFTLAPAAPAAAFSVGLWVINIPFKNTYPGILKLRFTVFDPYPKEYLKWWKVVYGKTLDKDKLAEFIIWTTDKYTFLIVRFTSTFSALLAPPSAIVKASVVYNAEVHSDDGSKVIVISKP